MNLLKVVGIGPGDPSLLTLAAVDAIKNSTVVAFPIAKKGGKSLAEKIVSQWITKDKKKLPLYFPMVFDSISLKKAWHFAGNELMKMIENGERVVFLSLGDISLFSTGSYVLMEFKKNFPECAIELIPGITSFSAAAAKSLLPLAFQSEQLLVLPVPASSSSLKALLQEAASIGRIIVLLKLGDKWSWVRPLLESLDLLETSIFAENIGFSDEQFMKASDVPPPSRTYFSLLIVRQNWPLIMP